MAAVEHRFPGQQAPERLLDGDPRLPALPLALDPGAVARLFAEHWPARDGAARAPGLIRACSLRS
ncbi:MAG TPA: hypothetical protein VHN78_13635, partial [Chloroflexota bacterium]|nr:hypothetical protein [Chloroflexota bacterium]